MDYINLHTHSPSGRSNILELVNQYPDDFDGSLPYFSIGIHPWYIKEEKIDADLDFIKSKLDLPNCLALGECGLDKRANIPFALQREVFEKQLLLAAKYQKPVIVHCVAAFQEVIEIKKRLDLSVPMVIHGFSKNGQVASSLLQNGFYLSFGKYLLRNPELETVFKSIPDGRFFLETDTVEEGIEAVYALAAKYKGINVPELQRLIQTNFNFAFQKNSDNG